MTTFDRMAALLPFAATLSEDGAVLDYLKDVQNMHMLSRILRRHSGILTDVAAALTGKPLPVVARQHFLVTLKELPPDALTLLIRLIRLCDVCGAPFVVRTLYAYRPESETALALLMHAEIERQEISLYACDMLRLIGGAFLKKETDLPSVRELLRNGQGRSDSRTGEEILQDITERLRARTRKEAQPNADDRDQP